MKQNANKLINVEYECVFLYKITIHKRASSHKKNNKMIIQNYCPGSFKYNKYTKYATKKITKMKILKLYRC